MEGVFSGKEALVIGGSGGIGAAVSLRLAAEGALVRVHGGSSQQRLDRTLSAIRAGGGTAEGFLCPLDRDGGAEELLSRFPAPDILVCAWGPFTRFSLEDTAKEDWEYLVKNNLILPGIMISSVLRAMIDKGWGRILLFGGTNTDSIRGFKTTAAYSAAKTALGSLAKSVAKSAGAAGVTCNVICPGLISTEYVDREGRAYNRRLAPNGLMLKPEDIAETAIHILKNPAINGDIIAVDGGLVI